MHRGAARGAAPLAFHQRLPNGKRARMAHTYFGPSFGDAEVRRSLEAFAAQIVWTRPEDYIAEVVKRLARGDVVGWFQGRMEFGPRALGNRSILADARRPDMKDRVNPAGKEREE